MKEIIRKLKSFDKGTFIFYLVLLPIVNGVIVPFTMDEPILFENFFVSFLITIPVAYIMSFFIQFTKQVKDNK